MVYYYINQALLWLMRAALLGFGVALTAKGDSLGLLALLAFVVTFIPSFLRAKYQVDLPWWLESLIVLGLFCDIIIGSEFEVYTLITGFDWFTHTLGTFIVSLIALSIVYSLKVTKQIKISNNMIWWFTVVFALAIGGFYEILEFLTDTIFHANAQISLTNTMLDLIFDMIGGVVTASWGSYYLMRLQGRKAKDVLNPYITLLQAWGFKIQKEVEKLKKKLPKR